MPFTSASGNQKNTSEVEESCRRTRTQAASSLPPGNGQDNEQGTMERAQRQQQILHPLRGSPPNEGSNHDQLAAAVAISSFPRHAQVGAQACAARDIMLADAYSLDKGIPVVSASLEQGELAQPLLLRYFCAVVQLSEVLYPRVISRRMHAYLPGSLTEHVVRGGIEEAKAAA